jgi:hypothetical protein
MPFIPTNFWGFHPEPLSQAEFAHPWSIFAPVFDIAVASPLGGEAPVDPSSLDAAETDDICATFLRDQEQLWKNTRKLEEFVDEVKDFDAVFFVGGYGRQCSPESFYYIQWKLNVNSYV